MGGSGRRSPRQVLFSVTLDELQAEPSEYVVHQALGEGDVAVGGHAHRFEALVSELVDEAAHRHAPE